jgi:hypothetical protein
MDRRETKGGIPISSNRKRGKGGSLQVKYFSPHCHFEQRRAAEWRGRCMKTVKRSPEISRLHADMKLCRNYK